jgi:hypothetical protein
MRSVSIEGLTMVTSDFELCCKLAQVFIAKQVKLRTTYSQYFPVQSGFSKNFIFLENFYGKLHFF